MFAKNRFGLTPAEVISTLPPDRADDAASIAKRLAELAKLAELAAKREENRSRDWVIGRCLHICSICAYVWSGYHFWWRTSGFGWSVVIGLFGALMPKNVWGSISSNLITQIMHGVLLLVVYFLPHGSIAYPWSFFGIRAAVAFVALSILFRPISIGVEKMHTAASATLPISLFTGRFRGKRFINFLVRIFPLLLALPHYAGQYDCRLACSVQLSSGGVEAGDTSSSESGAVASVDASSSTLSCKTRKFSSCSLPALTRENHVAI